MLEAGRSNPFERYPSLWEGFSSYSDSCMEVVASMAKLVEQVCVVEPIALKANMDCRQMKFPLLVQIGDIELIIKSEQHLMETANLLGVKF